MGAIAAAFKTDCAETRGAYSISEWWLEPRTQGPGAHRHPEDDVFYILAGTMSVLVGDAWQDFGPGSFILVPGGTTHDVENRGAVPVCGTCRHRAIPRWRFRRSPTGSPSVLRAAPADATAAYEFNRRGRQCSM